MNNYYDKSEENTIDMCPYAEKYVPFHCDAEKGTYKYKTRLEMACQDKGFKGDLENLLRKTIRVLQDIRDLNDKEFVNKYLK